ncbi:hypothetical protein CBP27_04380, partial [Fischerella thermalis WC542]
MFGFTIKQFNHRFYKLSITLSVKDKLIQSSLHRKQVTGDRFSKQKELLNLGLAVQQDNIKESNSPHPSIVKLSWVHQDLVNLRPFIRSTVKLFKLADKASCPEILVQEVLAWTGGQPFLTQKVCQLLCEYESFIGAGEEAAVVEQLVQNHLITNWQTQIAAEHLQTIQDGLIANPRCDSIWLLRLYQQILQQGELPVQDSPVQTELLNLGLVVEQENKLKISNQIYKSVFNLSWVDQQLANILEITPPSSSRMTSDNLFPGSILKAKNLIFQPRVLIFR